MERFFMRIEKIEEYHQYLIREEKAEATIAKYLRDVAAFLKYCGCREVTKELVIAYKQELIQKGYAVRSINSMLASLNSFFFFRIALS